MGSSVTAPLLAGLQAAEKTRATTPTNAPLASDPCVYEGRRYGNAALAAAERARDRKALIQQMKDQPDVWGYA